MEEDVEKADEEMNVGEAAPTRELAPEQAPAPLETWLVMAGIWAGGQKDQVAGPPVSLRARGKALNIQVEEPPLAEMDKELAHWLQAEK